MAANRFDEGELRQPPLHRFVDLETDPDRPVLLGSKCVDCERVHFPQHIHCENCLGETTTHRLSRTGSLYAFSIIHAGESKFDPPYTVGFVDLPEDIRIFAILDGEDLSIGDELLVDIANITPGQESETLSYIFRQVDR